MTRDEKIEHMKPLYRANLLIAHNKNNYGWPIEELDIVVERLFLRIKEAKFGLGTVNKNGLAFKRTASQLGMTNTYKNWDSYLR